MKIQNVSDLHLEFAPITIKNAGADVLTLSGDICVAHTLAAPDLSTLRDKRDAFRSFFKQVSKEFEKVFYVAGNHEHYHGRLDKTSAIIRDVLPENVHYLDNEIIEFGGVKFFGSTLWTDLNKNDPITIQVLKFAMNDYKLVKNKVGDIYRKMIPADTYKEHKRSLELIELYKPDVVIGHHGPSKQSIDSRYKSDDWSALNGGYVSDLENFILANPNIKLWTHGHTHSSHEYMIGTTKVICNPRGYHDENKDFDASRIWEI